MKKFTLIIFLSLTAFIAYSQCPPNNNQRVSVLSNNDGFLQTITSNFYTDEYVTISGILNTDEYEFKSIHSGSIPDYITITDESNVPLNYGMSPLTLNNINQSTIRVHIKANEACETDTFSHTLSLIDLTVEPTTCQKPEQSSVKIDYMSDKRIDIIWSEPIYGATPSDYYWEIVPAGNAQGVGVIASGTTGGATNFSTGDVLNPSTYYSIYLRSNCSDDSYSSFLGPLTPLYPTNSVPPPSNDFCSGAITLIEQTGIANSGLATSTAGSLLGGAGTDVNAESCNGKTGNSRDDIWYKFVAQTSNVHITVEPNPNFDVVVTLYSGNCNSLSYLACNDTNISSPSFEEINYTGLTVGQTYYTRAYYYGTIKPAILDFNIKIWSTTATTDNDSDGYSNAVDCNDNNAFVYPGAPEIVGNGIDENCDGQFQWYQDSDGDGYGSTTIVQSGNASPGAGESNNSTDCDDTRSGVNPGATEIEGNGLDDDCNSSTPDIPLGIEEFEKYGFSYYPNPVRNSLILKAKINIDKVDIYNILGQEIIKVYPNKMESKIDMTSLKNGLYFVKILINNSSKTIQIIKQ